MWWPWISALSHPLQQTVHSPQLREEVSLLVMERRLFRE